MSTVSAGDALTIRPGFGHWEGAHLRVRLSPMPEDLQLSVPAGESFVRTEMPKVRFAQTFQGGQPFPR